MTGRRTLRSVSADYKKKSPKKQHSPSPVRKTPYKPILPKTKTQCRVELKDISSTINKTRTKLVYSPQNIEKSTEEPGFINKAFEEKLKNKEKLDQEKLEISQKSQKPSQKLSPKLTPKQSQEPSPKAGPSFELPQDTDNIHIQNHKGIDQLKPLKPELISKTVNLNTSEEETESENDNMSAFSINEFSKIVPEFSGKETDTERFISCVDMYYSTLSNETSTSIMNFIQSKLSGVAFTFYQANADKTWAKFKELLRDKFSDKKKTNASPNRITFNSSRK